MPAAGGGGTRSALPAQQTLASLIREAAPAGSPLKTEADAYLANQRWETSGSIVPLLEDAQQAGITPQSVGYNSVDWKSVLIGAGIVSAGVALPLLTAGAAVAGGTDLASLGTTVPAGTAIAPSVELGADALGTGGIVGTTGATIAGSLPSSSMGTPLAADAAGTGATTAPAAGTISSLTDPAVANVPTGTLATTPEWTTPPGWTGLAAPAATTAGSSSLLTPTVLGAGISGGLGLLGAYLQSNAASNASAAQLQAAQEALALQAQMYNTNTGLNVAQANQKSQAYNTTQSNLAPYRSAGNAALSMLGYGLGLPGYRQGNQETVNAPPPVVPVPPLQTPAPVSLPGLSPAGTPIPRNPAQQTTTNSGLGAAQVGEQRVINGQLAQFDGTGWVAVGA